MADWLMNKSKRVTITHYQLEILKLERKRTGVSPQELLKNTENERPHGLNASLISAWLTGKVGSARSDYFGWVLKRYKAISTERTMLPISATMRSHLNTEKQRTGYGSIKLLASAVQTVPFGITNALVNSWLAGRTQRIDANHWDFIIKAFARLPDKKRAKPVKREKRVKFSDELKADLEKWRQSGLLASFLFRSIKKPPKNLTSNMVAGWLNGTSSTATKAHISFVQKHCVKFMSDPTTRVPIHNQMKITLKGLWYKLSQSGRDELPKTLCQKVEKYISGNASTVHPKQWQKLITKLKSVQ